MALLFIDGFDHYATADITKKWTASSGSVINASAGRGGGGALGVGAGGSNTKRVLVGSYGTLIAGFRYQPNALHSANNIIFRFDEGATNHIMLRLNNSTSKIDVYRGGSTLLGSTASTFALSAFTYVEIKVVIHDTTGSITIKLNGSGTADLTLTNIDTRNGGTGVIDTIYFGDPGTFAGNAFYDDFYLVDTSGSTNNDFLGDCRVDTLLPNGDGNYSQFTPSTGSTHYTLVDESTPNTTDYNDGAAVGDRDSYTMGNLTALTSQTVYGVQVNAALNKDDAGSKGAATFVRSSGTNGDGSGAALSTSQTYVRQIFETDPNGSIAWTESTVNAMEAGVKVTA